jgi:transcriptional regulator with XRE-family HTH domain
MTIHGTTQADLPRQLKTFGAALKDAYERAGVSKRQLAAAAKLDRSAIGKIERGERAPNFSKLLLLACGAGTTPAALLPAIEPPGGLEARQRTDLSGTRDAARVSGGAASGSRAAATRIEYDGEPPRDPVKRFGENLKWLRQHAEPRLTQEGLALEAGIDRSSPNGYETGRMSPNLRTILKLAAGLGMAPSLLMEGVELSE